MVNISSILDRLHIKYKVKGDSYIFHCINPEHIDKNPSMRMNEEGLFNCFACGESGNIYTFVKKLTGESLYTFLDIKDPMSYEFKQNLETEKRKQQTSFDVVEKRKLYQVGNLYPVDKNTEVMEYLRSINMNDEFIKHFDVTYTMHTEFKFFRNVKPTHFYNRIVIPVIEDGIVINMIGRDFTNKQIPKELYPKGSITDTFFNMENIDFNKPVVIVEGMKGLIRVWQHFTKNVMSSFGSSIGSEQQKIIKNIDNLLLFCDNDKAGYLMADQIYELRDKDFYITAMKTSDYDPADGTLDELKHALTHPMHSTDYYLRRHNMSKKRSLTW